MNTLTLVLIILAAFRVESIPISSNLPELNTSGFIQPSISLSSGGSAICVAGIVPVTAWTDQNLNLDLPSSFNQTQIVELTLELNSANSTLASSVVVSEQKIGGVYNISAQLCYPVAARNSSTVQFLTHGVAFSKSYWDFSSPTNSYIESAAQAGYSTFSYDRLGIEGSSRPDPIQVVQGPLQTVIAESLVNLLRNGSLGGQSFPFIIGVGHSYGSALTTSLASKSPSAFDALVLTGFSDNMTGAIQFAAALNFEVAARSSTQRFVLEPDGYLLPSTLYGVQYSFFRSPDFANQILAEAFATIQTTTIGEQFSMSTVGGKAANFTGPVLIVDGDNDLCFCDGNCLYPVNIPQTSLSNLFPKADPDKSGVFVLDGSGHGVNLASNAMEAFDQIQAFVRSIAL